MSDDPSEIEDIDGPGMPEPIEPTELPPTTEATPEPWPPDHEPAEPILPDPPPPPAPDPLPPVPDPGPLPPVPDPATGWEIWERTGEPDTGTWAKKAEEPVLADREAAEARVRELSGVTPGTEVTPEMDLPYVSLAEGTTEWPMIPVAPPS